MNTLNRLVLSTALLGLMHTTSFGQKSKNSLLASVYSDYTKTKSVQAEKRFFSEFPNSFKEFQEVYGYDDVKGPSPNYKVAFQHVELFFKAALCVDSTTFANKLINICLNGKWEADAENYLQENLHDYFINNHKVVVKSLAKRTQPQIDSFWFFYLDGPEFNQKVYQQTNKMLTDEPKMKQSLLKASVLIKKQNKK